MSAQIISLGASWTQNNSDDKEIFAFSAGDVEKGG